MEQNRRNAYFIRIIGTNASYLTELQKLDELSIEKMNTEKWYYQRLDSLPRMQNVEDTTFYTKCYEGWINSGKKEIITKVTGKYPQLANQLANVSNIIEKLYKQEQKQATDSMVKNFVVKLLFWYDSVFADEKFHYEEGMVAKIAVSNIVKKQDYYFFYLVAQMGCDVLLLQSKGDIAPEEEKLELSTKFVLGEFSEAVLPPYRWHETVPVQTEQVITPQTTSENTGRITVKIPERNRPSRHPAQSAPATSVSNTPPRVVIPPRPSSNRQAPVSASTGSQQNARVTIPPRASSAPARTTAASAPVSSAEKSFEELALLASSIVMITVLDGKGERLGSGSGIMIGKEGYILTNNHVASGGRCFLVRIEDDDQEYRTDEIIKYHSILDLAIIRIQRKLNPLPVYQGTKTLVRGQKVVAIGSPLGLFNSVSNGIISGFRKFEDVDMIQFTAPTSRGSSGGAVLNMQGEVIGISTAGIDAGQNINLAMGYECINTFIRGFI